MVFAVCCAYFLFCGESMLYAEEKIPIEITGDKVEYLSKEKRMEAAGNATLTYQDITLTCDKLSLDVIANMAYAEGNVVVHQENAILTGESIVYDLTTKQGKAIKIGIESDIIYGVGESIDRLSDREIQLRRGYFSTCDLKKPHYRIWAKKLLIYPGDRVIAKNAYFYLGEVPVFYLPQYVHLLHDDRPRVTVIPGKEKDWGYFILSAWRYYLNEGAKGRIHFDFREKRDLAIGFDLFYEPKDFGEDWKDIDLGTGSLKVYYMHERKINRSHLWTLPPYDATKERERFRIQWRHEWEIDPYTEAIWQYNRFRDKTFMKDYFYRDEYEKDRDPDTYLLVTHARPGYNLSLLERKRVNRYRDVIERQPEIKFNINSHPILDNYFDRKSKNIYTDRVVDPYFLSETTFSNLVHKRPDSDLDDDVVRFDTYNKLSFPKRFFYISLDPYVAIRETAYSKDVNGDSIDPRAVFYYGIDTSAKFFRIFNFDTNFLNLDINDLRHIVTPSVNYAFINDPTIPPSKFLQFDGIDSQVGSETITFSLENKLQTKRDNKTVDLLRFITNTSYDLYNTDGSRFSNVKYDLEIIPNSNSRIELDSEYDTQEYVFRNLNVDVIAHSQGSKYQDVEIFGDDWSYGAGYRYERKGSKQLTTQVEYRLNSKWKFEAYERFELARGKDLREQEYTLFRDLHCWVLQLTYNVTREYGEAVWLVFKLKAFPEMGVEFENSYHQPKFGSQSTTFMQR